MSKTTNKFSPEVRDRAVRLVLDNEGQHGSRWQAVMSISAKMGCAPQTLNEWVKKAEVDSGRRAGIPTEMAEKIKALERENRELRQANEILRKASAYFAMADTRPPVEVMVSFIDAHRDAHGVEPICSVLPIAPSTYYDHLAKRADPTRQSDRARRDEALRPEILRVFEENRRVYGVRKVWRQLGREGFDIAVRRFSRTGGVHPLTTVARLMKSMGIQGIIRGKPHRTTIPDRSAPCPLDKVNRQFRVPAPNMLWGRPLWRHWSEPNGRRLHLCRHLERLRLPSGHALEPMAGRPSTFVIDAYARKIVGWRVSTSAHAGLVLDTVEQAVHERRPTKGMGLIHHSDRGLQYLSIRYSERLAEAGIEPSVGNVGDSYDNALAETINGLFKAEVIHRRGSWRGFDAVEYATLEWVDWFNNRRLLKPIGNVPPAEAEANFYAALGTEVMAA